MKNKQYMIKNEVKQKKIIIISQNRNKSKNNKLQSKQIQIIKLTFREETKKIKYYWLLKQFIKYFQWIFFRIEYNILKSTIFTFINVLKQNKTKQET